MTTKQQFNIVRIETSMDMGIGDRRKEWTSIAADDLAVGKVFRIHGNELTVVSVDENEMEFTYTCIFLQQGQGCDKRVDGRICRRASPTDEREQ